MANISRNYSSYCYFDFMTLDPSRPEKCWIVKDLWKTDSAVNCDEWKLMFKHVVLL